MDTTSLSDNYDEIIHYDARYGYKTSLEAYLNHKPECINKLYVYGESKWTVLLAACYYQHEAIVEMLINHFKADVEAEGTIVVNDPNRTTTIVDGASPLWAAASVNNFNIVKFLVQYGLADVNHLTKEHSTPLRAACYNGNLEMVQFLIQYGANPHQVKLNNETNLMLVVFHQYIDLVTYFVDDIKCDLNQQDKDGQTALHIAVEHDFIEISKLLISRGALNLCDKFRNMTPLVWAAVHGRMDYVTAFDGHCSDIEWIEARELLGSAFAGCKPSIENRNLAIECLTLAFEARATKNIPKHRSNQTLEIFNNRRECETLEDFNELMSVESREILYIEGLLIQERLLGTIGKNYRRSLRRIGGLFASRNQYGICLRLWFYELDLRRQYNEPFNDLHLRHFASLFAHILWLDKSQVSINELCKILTIMTDELSSLEGGEAFNYNLITLLQLLTISAQLLFNDDIQKDYKLSREDGKVLIQHIQSIVKENYVTDTSGSSLLHLCCDEDTKELQNYDGHVLNLTLSHRYPCLMTVRLLVFCGIDVNAMDSANKTALHILVQNSQNDKSMAIIDFLCKTTDVHIDFADNNGKSPIEYSNSIFNQTNTRVKRLQQKTGVTSLKCHCARLAKYRRLPYKECLSSNLVNFVQKH